MTCCPSTLALYYFTAVMKLTFEDVVDLQSRLVLLPRVEEEGLGAIVASFRPAVGEDDKVACFQEEKKVDEDEETSSSPVEASDSMDSVALTGSDHGRSVMSAVEQQSTAGEESLPEDQNEEETNDQARDEEAVNVRETPLEKDQEVRPEDLIGKSLIGIDGVETDEDWLATDFSQILASIREVKTPIVLEFEYIPIVVEEVSDTGHVEEEGETASNTSNEEQEATPLNAWSSWGKSFAATAASSAKVYASATAQAVQKRAEEARAARAKAMAEQTANSPNEPEQKCCAFLQMIDGGFLKLTGPLPKPPKITTTSVVLVRQSTGDACPLNTHRFQWYRSVATPKSTDISSDSSRESHTSGESSADGDIQWASLEGATYAAYQPNATDIGHRLRCVVSIEMEEEDEVNFSEDDVSVFKEETVICCVPVAIAADMSMFNAARQALSRGALFGNIEGRGPAEGRIFSIHVEISMNAEDRSISSATSIQQVSGQTSEPIHGGVIKHASAIADPSNSKHFELVFPSGLPEESSMVTALSVDGRFQLATPNRVTRETLLFALGIANYSGKPVDLTETTVLYAGHAEQSASPEAEPEPLVTPVKQVIGTRDAEFFTPRESLPQNKLFDQGSPGDQETERVRVLVLEQELQSMVAKLSRKDKVINDLQRQLVQSESRAQKAERKTVACQQTLQKTQEESRENLTKMRSAEKRVETQSATLARLKGDHSTHLSSLENRNKRQSEMISDLEKLTKSLQNEKAVMSAAIDARDSKLEKMKELQAALDALSLKAAKGDSLRSEMTDMSKRYEMLCNDLEQVAASETECKEQLEKVLATMNELYQSLESEKSRRKQGEKEAKTMQQRLQQLKAERNSYKQKTDSLTKEVGRLCRGGRTLGEIDKIILDDESRKTEVAVLRTQKQKALEELQQYRSAYEQQLVAQLNIGVDGAAVKALEQKAELERVVADMTEYLNAKEMQLDTLKQVNEALSEEMKQLAKVNMSKNDI